MDWELAERVRKREIQYQQVVAEAAQLFQQKNEEYGDSIVHGGVVGAVVEFIGIAGRFRKLVLTEEQQKLPHDVRKAILWDKALDAVNYGAIVLMMLQDDNWSGIPLPEEGGNATD